MKNNALFAALALLFVSATASAQSATSGVYVGAGVSLTKGSVDYLLPAGVKGDSSQYSLFAPGRLFGGYALNQNWALEAGATRFGRADQSYSGSSGAGQIEARSRATYLAVKYSMALDEKWSAFGKAGVAHNTYRVDGSGASAGLQGKTTQNGAYLGLGLDYAITPHAGVVVEYENFNHMKRDGGRAGAFSVSGRYTF